MKTVLLAYCGFGKTYFCKKCKKPVFETPLRPVVDLAKGLGNCIYKEEKENRENKEFKNLEIEDTIYKFIFDYLAKNQPDAILLGPAIPEVYRALKRCFKNEFNIVVLIPEREAYRDFFHRYEERASDWEKALNKVEKQKNSWDPWHSFFEDISNTDPNIIFTKSGEYLTDYLDPETGEFKKPELLSF